MNRKILRALLWKEWREHQGRLIACCAIVGAWSVLEFQRDGRTLERSVQSSFHAVMLVSVLVLPIFVCMAIGSERGSGRLEALLSRPVPAWMVLGVKTLIGSITCAAPVLTVGLLGWLLLEPHIAQKLSIGAATMWGTAAAVIVYTWMLTLSSRRTNEAAVGLQCVALLAGGFAVLVALEEMNPYKHFIWEADPPRALRDLAVLTILHWVWAAWLFGGPIRSRARADTAGPNSRSHAPRKLRPLAALPASPVAALFWKEWLLNRAWCGAGIAATVLIFIVLGIRSGQWIGWFLLALLLLAVLLPVTSVGREFDSPAHRDLLRSRPISCGHWYAVKYTMGLGLVLSPLLLSLGIVVGSVIFASMFDALSSPLHSAEHLAAHVLRLLTIGVAAVLAYSLSMFVACAIRQPIYSGILSTGLIVLIWLLPTVYDLDRWTYRLLCSLIRQEPQQAIPGWFRQTFWLAMGFFAVLGSVAATWLGWQMVRWHWRTDRKAAI